jgi:uncharacterized membrane protein YhaH (DUF805 family)
MNWYLKVMKQNEIFTGRAQRAEYWYFVLFYAIVYIVLMVVDVALGLYNIESGFGVLSGIWALIHIVPGIGVAVRRLHDIGKSGWWYLLVLIPLVGIFIILIFLAKDSVNNNQYGISPKKSMV